MTDVHILRMGSHCRRDVTPIAITVRKRLYLVVNIPYHVSSMLEMFSTKPQYTSLLFFFPASGMEKPTYAFTLLDVSPRNI